MAETLGVFRITSLKKALVDKHDMRCDWSHRPVVIRETRPEPAIRLWSHRIP